MLQRLILTFVGNTETENTYLSYIFGNDDVNNDIRPADGVQKIKDFTFSRIICIFSRGDKSDL